MNKNQEKLKKLEKIMKEFIIELGLDVNSEGLRETPKRVAKMWYNELTLGNHTLPPKIKMFTGKKLDQLIVLKDIPFFSVCEHHFVTFYGKVFFGYLPDKKYVGFSKVARVIKYFASRPQTQEIMGEDIAEYLDKQLEPQGLIVVIKGEHMCIESRGAKAIGTIAVTSAIRGKFGTDNSLKEEFFKLLSL